MLHAVAQRVPAHVDGDGKVTVSDLVALTNADPRRGIGHEKVLTRIAVDEEAEAYAAEQGFALDAVPPKGTRVFLKRTGNMSTGGISIDWTEEIHPENQEIAAEQAAKVIGLDIAGIDSIYPDISVLVRETGGGIVEVTAAPGFRCTPTRPRVSPSVRGSSGHRNALPARHALPDPNRGRHWDEWEDDYRPDDQPHPQGHGPQGGDDQHRRHSHRRPADRRGDRRPEIGVDGPPEPARGHGRVRGRARLNPARGPGLPAQ